MKDYLLIEKSKFSVKSVEGVSGDDKYTLEGVFTEFDSENRNGRVYTKKEFQPHFDALKKVIDSGTCVGELDHPKQFETTLKNVAHKIEDIWMDDDNNRVMGRIKLLDTDAGKQAKALIDGGIPLHISSRAAGTVTENKTVKMHKLFTYDLVDTPGFANARLGGINESFGMLNESEEFSDFAIYEVKKQIQSDMYELNNKNKEVEKMEYIKENEFNKYTDFTKEAIDNVKSDIAEMKEIQESIIEQNDSIVDEYSNADFKTKLEDIDKKIVGISEWADHVKEEFEALNGDESQAPVEDVIGDATIQEQLEDMTTKYEALEVKFEAMVQWSNHTTNTVSALEKWSDHSSDTVSALEKWSDHSSDTVTNLEENVETVTKWSEHVTETVTKLEEGVQEIDTKENTTEKINENKISDFKKSIYSKLGEILDAKEQKATDDKSLNESKSAENENPLWMSMMPAKYAETWKGLDESEKERITKRASLFDFVKESAIKDFWNNEFTKENLIKEEKIEQNVEEQKTALTEARLAKVKGFTLV